MQAEAGSLTEGADRAAPDGGRESLAGILDDRHAPPLRDLDDGRHVDGIAGEMHRHERARPGRDGALDEGSVDVVLGVDIHKHRPCAGRHDGADAGNEGIGGRHHLVARPHPDRL